MRTTYVNGLTIIALSLFLFLSVNAQFVGPAPLVVPGDNYVFAYSPTGTTADLTNFGMYFDKTSSYPGFEFRGLAGAVLAKVHTLPAGNREAGDISFGATGSLIVGSNRYAFRHSIVDNYGLYFNASDVDYEFRTADASPIFAIGANSGDIRTTGRIGVGTMNPVYKVHIEQRSEPSAIFINNQYMGSGTSYGICNESRDTSVTNTRFGYKNYMTGGTGSRVGFSSTIFASPANTSNIYGFYSLVDKNATTGNAYAIFGSADISAENIWSGYFTGKNYMNELSIGSPARADGFKLSVDGKAIVEELLVLEVSEWPDYVFAENYDLMPIQELKNSITTNQHLPGIPSASEVHENGIAVGDMQKKMMKKIEELTLYIIELSEEIDRLKKIQSSPDTDNRN